MAELIHQFGIDWRLLVAQAVNFGILFFVLYRFAYRPVFRILNERKEKIAEGLKMREEAEERLSKADEERQSIIKRAEEEAFNVVTRADAVGRERGEKVLREALLKSEEVIKEGRRRAEEEKRIAAEEFSKEAVELIRAATARVLGKMPAAERDRELIHEALIELKTTQ